tara:strand:- start:337 stop:579 length:243 start_codon:yes stop_codon:yes gene_type:complete
MFIILKNDPAEIGRMLAEEQQKRQQAMAQQQLDPTHQRIIDTLRQQAAEAKEEADAAQAKAEQIRVRLQQEVARIGGGGQ